MGPGDTLLVTCGGAGGWGDPLTRDPEAVLKDFRRGWVSAGHAREAYGVVLEDGAVDARATAVLRVELAAKHPANGFYDLGPERTAFEAVWTEANYDALTECLASLPVHWRFYAKHRIFAALDEMEAPSTDGGDVRAAFEALLDEFPQLLPAAAE